MKSYIFLVLVAFLVNADLYMHAPPGNNNRNRERKNNRNNANRLFDSQNNGQGGYPYRGDPSLVGEADPVVYYHGSYLNIEWTNQHACGPNPDVHCELVIQFAIDAGDNNQYTSMPGLRDGYPTGHCTDTRGSANDNDAASCEGTTCDATCNATQAGHWVARQFQSVNQNNKQRAGTNTIPDPTQQGSTNLAGKTAAERNAFYRAASSTARVERNTGTFDYGVEFGMHEDNKWYERCAHSERNKGLFTIDQQLNRNDARATRQNPNGNRRGLECPEEAHYYPYWTPSPWYDIAVLVSNTSYCSYFQENSQNVVAYGQCLCPFLDADDIQSARNTAGHLCPIDKTKCEQYGYTWQEVAAKTNVAPDCRYHSFGRDNHLGNTLEVDENGVPITPKNGEEPKTAKYQWKVPDWIPNDSKLVIRLRYNMSTNDYPSHQFAEASGTLGVGVDANTNCPWYSGSTACSDGNPDCATGTGDNNAFSCGTALTANAIPLYNRPYVNLFDEPATRSFALSLAINTHQTGRTFQDRSYVFKVQNKPASVPAGATITNLGVRGRRGNIVQSYPAVEYDFTPTISKCSPGDYLHIQLHGSDFNAQRNANNGEGWEYSDRHNLVQMSERGMNYPMHHSKFDMFSTLEEQQKWAWVGQKPALCDTSIQDDNNGNQNKYQNCGKLNMAPNRFPLNPEEGLYRCHSKSTFNYASTRNNNFSNRSHKAALVGSNKDDDDEEDNTDAAVVGSMAAVLGVSLIGLGAAVYMKSKGIACFAAGASAGGGGGGGVVTAI
mmetsp:Transcript_13985/g.19614  ORF Transcript_13985/g.19614 Transcript_13985/m.19614 type:complete len:778 (+) Transcript_13985:129-2462(+)